MGFDCAGEFELNIWYIQIITDSNKSTNNTLHSLPICQSRLCRIFDIHEFYVDFKPILC